MNDLGLRILVPLLPHQLVEKPVEWAALQRAVEGSPHGETVDTLLERVYGGGAVIWSWGHGVLVTEFHQYPGGLECFVHSLAGERYVEVVDAIREDLETIAKLYRCKWVSYLTTRPGMEKIAEGQGMSLRATYWMKDLG